MSTAIQWTDETWNPITADDKVTGKGGWFCAHVSPGCVNCYAETMNLWRGNGQKYRVPNAEKLNIGLRMQTLFKPLRWRRPRRVFVCSMTDLFLDEHTDEMIDRVFAVMAMADQHTFQVLTKRAERMREYLSYEYRWADIEAACTEMVGRDEAPALAKPDAKPRPNVWLGVSVENQRCADERIPLLLQTPAAIRFLSVEPLLSSVILWRAKNDPTLGPAARFVDWVIIGGESGKSARPFDLAWARSVLAQCQEADVPAFVKQLGAVPIMAEHDWRERIRLYGVVPLLHARNRDRVPPGFVPLKFTDSHGGEMDEWPADLRVREFPASAVPA